MTSRVYARPPLEIISMLNHEIIEEKSNPLHFYTDQLPAHLVWFGSQIAGHKTEVKAGLQTLGFIKDRNFSDRILKPVMNDKRGACEKNFYLDVFSPSSSLRAFRRVIPQYYGLRDLLYKGTNHQLLELEDISDYFTLPAVIDIKIGQKTFGPDASAEKMKKEQAKYPPQEEIGFRMLGYKVESKAMGHRASRDREWCLNLGTGAVEAALLEFLSHRGKEMDTLVEQMLLQLEEIKEVVSLGLIHLYSSSLLIAYEAHENSPIRAEIRMIDFSHVYPANNNSDENYLFGLNSLIQFLINIQSNLNV